MQDLNYFEPYHLSQTISLGLANLSLFPREGGTVNEVLACCVFPFAWQEIKSYLSFPPKTLYLCLALVHREPRLMATVVSITDDVHAYVKCLAYTKWLLLSLSLSLKLPFHSPPQLTAQG